MASQKVSNTAVSSSNQFSLDLFKLLADENTNVFFSPASISIALAMTYLGSRENTAVQLAKAMHWDGIRHELLDQDMGKLFDILSKVDGANTVTLANRFWVQKSFTILDTYTQALQNFYRSSVEEADFVQKADEVRMEINNWVDQKTQGKIKELIGSGILNAMTRAVLVNAIHFKGVWKSEFNEEETFNGNFHVTKDNFKEMPMMSRTGQYQFGESKELNAQIIELPYSKDQLSMIIILPREIEGLAQVEQKLTIDSFRSSVSSLRKVKVEVTIPKFKLTSQFELSKVLPKLGVVDLFDECLADLSGITGEKNLYVSNVIHKAFVEVNEKGTEAAAATAVVMMYRLALPNPRFFANHPFLYFIRENATGAILFMGRMQDPSDG